MIAVKIKLLGTYADHRVTMSPQARWAQRLLEEKTKETRPLFLIGTALGIHHFFLECGREREHLVMQHPEHDWYTWVNLKHPRIIHPMPEEAVGALGCESILKLPQGTLDELMSQTNTTIDTAVENALVLWFHLFQMTEKKSSFYLRHHVADVAVFRRVFIRSEEPWLATN